MGLVLKRRGQISLEFMLVFAIMLIMLLYSVRNVTFSSDSPSNGALAVQIALEEKSTANTIAGLIDQVYAQGPGSKATAYVKFALLRNEGYLKRAFNLSNPVVSIMFLGSSHPLFPPNATNSVVAVAVFNNGSAPLLVGSNRTGVWVPTYFPYNSTVDPGFNVTIAPTLLPSSLKVVVEWNPDLPVGITYNSTSQEVYINIHPGGS
ncbi:class III signal peptide-containing protein [Thermococcus sp.]|uniref:class III signal peptide-containing protein n=1 Tax=Thermococcus sp. TaxID=35749 RepID=UPI0026399D08|nr:class III signal peptide-containing protein [Thermococcus sp.]